MQEGRARFCRLHSSYTYTGLLALLPSGLRRRPNSRNRESHTLVLLALARNAAKQANIQASL
jgi:hypothetical protein